jgi:hypothetical protein
MKLKITNKGLLIENLLINDSETVEYYRKSENSTNDFGLAVKIGTIMLEKANIVNQSDYLERRIAEIFIEVEKRTNGLMQSLESTIHKTFNPDETDSAIGIIKQVFDAHLEPHEAIPHNLH